MEKKHKGSGTEEDKCLIKSNDNKRDCISALPDEILSNIISLLTLRDAARSRLASRRWGFPYASMPKLEFNWRNMFATTPESSNPEVCPSQLYKDKFVNIVDQYLKLYVGQKVINFSVAFCLGKEDACYLDGWIGFAVRMGVENLMLGLSCKKSPIPGKTIHNHDLYVFPCHLLTCGEVSKLKHLFLQSAILGPNLTDQFSNLEKLVLIYVPLSQTDVQTIFGSCFKLESLTLVGCGLPDDKLCISASLCNLKFVTFSGCSGVKEIEFSSNSLTKFEYMGGEVQLSFLEVPNLDTLHFCVTILSGYKYIFSEIGRSLPRIKTLSVFIRTCQLESLQLGLTAFSKIEHLELYFNPQSEFDTEKMIAIVRTCPLLKKLHIETGCIHLTHGEQSREYNFDPAKENIHHLKEVEIGGFHGAWIHISFAIYLLKHAVALERMVINPKAKVYVGKDCWFFGNRVSWDEGERERVYEQLKEHVCSEKLMLIIR